MILGLAFNKIQNHLHSPTVSPPQFPQNIQSPVLCRTITCHTIRNINSLRLKPENLRVPISLFSLIWVSKQQISMNTISTFCIGVSVNSSLILQTFSTQQNCICLGREFTGKAVVANHFDFVDLVTHVCSNGTSFIL